MKGTLEIIEVRANPDGTLPADAQSATMGAPQPRTLRHWRELFAKSDNTMTGFDGEKVYVPLEKWADADPDATLLSIFIKWADPDLVGTPDPDPPAFIKRRRSSQQ
jgi:hypothetical protein